MAATPPQKVHTYTHSSSTQAHIYIKHGERFIKKSLIKHLKKKNNGMGIFLTKHEGENEMKIIALLSRSCYEILICCTMFSRSII